MAEKFNYTGGGFGEALAVFPDLPWKASAAGTTWVYDEKQSKYVELNEGDWIVKVGNRYEVSDEEPKDTKRSTVHELTVDDVVDTDEKDDE